MPRLRPPIVPGSTEIVVAKYRTLPSSSDNTVAKQPHPAQFKPGQSGNPQGRPRGARNKLGETFLNDLVQIWAEKGPAALKIVAETEPAAFCKLVSTILPKEVVSLAMSVSANVTVDLNQRAQSFMGLWNHWREQSGEPAELELTAEAEAAYKLDGDDD